MQDQPPSASSSVDARAATIKLVFKKALLSKLGHSASSAAEQLIDDPEDAAPDTPKTSEKKNEKQSAASGAKNSSKANAASSKAATPKSATSKASSTPSKAAVVKPSPKAAPSKVAPKKATPRKQKGTENPIDAASITSELGRCVMSSTAGLDLADAAGESIPFTRVKRMMKELLGDMKLSNESVAAVICSCHGFINYMTLQAAQSASKSDLCYDDLANVVQDSDSLEFLDEVVPQRVTAGDAAAINAHLKLAQGVAVNSQKKVTALIHMLL